MPNNLCDTSQYQSMPANTDHSHSIVNNPRIASIGAGFLVVTSVNTMKNTIINNLFPVTYHPVNNSCCVRLQSPS